MLAGGLWVPLYGHTVGNGWLYSKGVFMPDMFGWTGALAVTLSSLVIFYFFINRFESRKKLRAEGSQLVNT